MLKRPGVICVFWEAFWLPKIPMDHDWWPSPNYGNYGKPTHDFWRQDFRLYGLGYVGPLANLAFVNGCWKRAQIAMLDPLKQNFRDALGGGPNKEKSDRPPRWWFKPLCFLMTPGWFIVPSLSSFWWLVYLVMWFSDSAPGASCDRSKLSSSKVPPQIWAKGMSLAQRKKRRKAMDLPAK